MITASEVMLGDSNLNNSLKENSLLTKRFMPELFEGIMGSVPILRIEEIDSQLIPSIRQDRCSLFSL
jgi:hypothetical protein